MIREPPRTRRWQPRLFLQELVAELRAEGTVESLPTTVEAVIGARILEYGVEPEDAEALAPRRGARDVGRDGAPGRPPRRRRARLTDGNVVASLEGIPRARRRRTRPGPSTRSTRDAAYQGLPLPEPAGAPPSGRRESLERRAEFPSRKAPRCCRSTSCGLASKTRHGGTRSWPANEPGSGSRPWRRPGSRTHARGEPRAPRCRAGRSSAGGGGARRRVRAGRHVPERGVRAYRQARTVAVRGSTEDARLCIKDGVLRLRMGRYPRRSGGTGVGLDVAAGAAVDAAVRVELGLGYAGVRYYQGRYRGCSVVRGDGADRPRERRQGGARARVLPPASGLHASWEPRSRRVSRTRVAALRRAGRSTRQGHVLNNVEIDAYYEGDWARAAELYDRGREALEKAGGVVDAADVLYNIADDVGPGPVGRSGEAHPGDP